MTSSTVCGVLTGSGPRNGSSSTICALASARKPQATTRARIKTRGCIGDLDWLVTFRSFSPGDILVTEEINPSFFVTHNQVPRAGAASEIRHGDTAFMLPKINRLTVYLE